MARLLRDWLIGALMMSVVGMVGCGPQTEPAKELDTGALVVLRNDRIELGVWPEAGGRAVLLRRPGGPNVLQSEPAHWSKPVFSPKDAKQGYWWLRPYDGHIVWVAPQKDWWAQQDINPQRKKERSDWPPDVYQECGRFRIIRQSPTEIELQGPASPLTGLQMTKRYAIGPDGRVELSVEAKNIRKTPVTWGLWSNTRVPAGYRPFVPLAAKVKDQFRFGYSTVELPKTPFAFFLPRCVNGFFTFEYPPARRGDEVVGKAFIIPARSLIAAFGDGQVFLKTWPAMTPTGDVAPGHSSVEVYQQINLNTRKGVLELEFHSPYRKLEPGQTLRQSETWRVLPYRGENQPEAETHFLADVLKSSSH